MQKEKVLKRIIAVAVASVLILTMIPVFTSASEVNSPLKGKKILFAGDSIGAGWRDNAGVSDYTSTGGWAKRIADDYGADVTLAATAGAPLSTIREHENRPAIVEQLHANKDKDFDYVVLQGGFNDAMGTNAEKTKESAAKVGELTEYFDVAEYDTSTFAGALEHLFYYAKEYYPNARVGFIITYATPTSTYGGYTAENEAMKEYWDMAKAACEKWGVSYLDLFEGTTADGRSFSYDILDVENAGTNGYFPGGSDTIHLAAKGYDVITPYIASWLPNTIAVRGGSAITWEEVAPTDAITYLDFESEYRYAEPHPYYNFSTYYSSTTAENWVGGETANNRGSYSKFIIEQDGNTAALFTWDSDSNNENYNANVAMNIYDANTKKTFVGEAGKWYTITFKVKVTKSDNVPLQFYLATCGRTYENASTFGPQPAFSSTDVNFNHINAMRVATSSDLRVYKAGGTFTAPTDGWVTVSADWYADGTHFPLLGVTANNKTTINGLTDYAAVLVDDIYVTEKNSFTQDFENTDTFYDGNTNKTADSQRGTNAFIKTIDGNKVMHFTWDKDNGNRNYADANAISILDSTTGARFVGEEGVTYTISFKYKILHTDGQQLQFFASKCGRDGLGGTDMGPKAMRATYAGNTDEPSYTAISGKLSTVSSDWETISFTFTPDGTVSAQTSTIVNYPIIALQANGKNTASGAPTSGSYASVIIDDISVKEYKKVMSKEINLNLNQSEHSNFYEIGNPNNWSSDNHRGSVTEWATDTDGNSVIRFTWSSDNDNENYNANAALKILDPSTGERFAGEVGQDYVITFKYKVENTGGKDLQFYLAPTNRKAKANPSNQYYDLANTDLGPLATMPGRNTSFIPAGTIVADGEWHTITTSWKGMDKVDGFDVYPLLLLQCNGKSQDAGVVSNYASVLVDNIHVAENIRGKIPAYNYGEAGVTELTIYRSTTFGELQIPERKGYVFDGFYTDAALTKAADANETVGSYRAIYVKWAGDGTAVTPSSVKETMTFSATKSFDSGKFVTQDLSLGYDFTAIGATVSRDKNTAQVAAGNVSGWNGEYVISSDKLIENTTEPVVIDNLQLATPAHSILFYVELPDFAKAGKTSALSLGKRGVCLFYSTDSGTSWNWFNVKKDGSSTFAYTSEGEWKTSNFSADGAFTGLPSGYKGYIRIDFDTLNGNFDVTAKSYKLNCVELIPTVLGGNSGDLVLGGIAYSPAARTNGTVWKIKNTISASAGTYNYSYYDICNSSAMVVAPYDAYSNNAYFSTRYSGTVGTAAVKVTEKETSAFFAENPVSITTISGNKETTTGYMTTYANPDLNITLQPGIDSFMLYVELPEFTEGTLNAPLKLLDTTISQTGTERPLMFSNSAYSFASVYDGIWVDARAGADGDLKDLPSGFKGFIRFNIKDFKNYSEISVYNSNNVLSGIDLSKPYVVNSLTLGFNHVGGKDGELTIGAAYSVLLDSDKPFIKHNVKDEAYCYKAIQGDFNADGVYSADEVVKLRKALIGDALNLTATAKLRTDKANITHLVAATKGVADTSNEGVSPIYPNIFSADVGTTSGAVVYERVQTSADDYQVITTDYEAYREKGDAFAAELLGNQLGTFEKTGIDKMCHVSTFYYSHGNVYASYYANTVSASENPAYQVARLAYAPEDDLSKKVIIDIMQVGDELYGKKITGVYDTILMPKEDEPDNLYILWTAAVNGEYYRLYQVFNMETETLGPIGVNRFKVGNTTNDFSREGMKKALNNEGHGYKTFASDIGIMQKLSTRVENGVTYYYTGAYCCDFTCIIKSKDLITWEYVAQPNEGANGTGFENCTRWENAVYVVGDKVYYYVRQWDPLGVQSNGVATTGTTNRDANGSYYGILTAYDLVTGEWEKPVLVEDCQSRSDFIMYKGNLYLIYAPTPEYGGSDRQHLGILKIDTNDLSKTSVVLQAQIKTSCFYPFWQFNSDGELCISYTYARKEIRISSIDLSKYLD